MHEYPITKRIIEIAEETAQQHGAEEVKAINLVVGDYSGYVASSVELYFELIAKDSRCEHAKLNITRVAPKLFCPKCNELFVREPFSFVCPTCGTEGAPTEVGKEFYIKSIEV